MGEGVKRVLPPVCALTPVDRADLDNAVLIHADFGGLSRDSVCADNVRPRDGYTVAEALTVPVGTDIALRFIRVCPNGDYLHLVGLSGQSLQRP